MSKATETTKDSINYWLRINLGYTDDNNTIGPLNFDSMDINDLDLFLLYCDREDIDTYRYFAERLFGLPEVTPQEVMIQYEKVIGIYYRYVNSKVNAIKYRTKGYINRALMFEKWCDEDYKSLPKFARW